jgi:hypothetical protein
VVLENRVLKRIFVPKRKEVEGGIDREIYRGNVWTVFMWLRLRTSGGLL